jgi:molybdopterin/thiamine biosynthesis adenylyltransferase
MGSKVATSLARAGVGCFNLIDDDVFLCENLVRNDLDWQSLGSHKADALSRRLRLVNPDVVVTVHRVHLNGQESSTRIAAALSAAAECDVIIDATADASVFNLLAGIAHGEGKTMIWTEVFGGGIGGMMARFRPGHTPTPARMRAITNKWCTEQVVPWVAHQHGYETRDDGGAVLVADDADVSVIAAHTARYALDHLLGHNPPEYKHSVYLIGLKRAWIFDEPFDTYPIDVGSPEEVQPPALLSGDQLADTTNFLTGLIDGMTRANTASG